MTYNNNRNHFLNTLIVVLSVMVLGMVLIGKARTVSASAANQVSAETVRAHAVSSYEAIQVQGISGAPKAAEADWTISNTNNQSVRVTWTIQSRDQKVSGVKIVPANDFIIFTATSGRMTYSVEVVYMVNGMVSHAMVGEREIVRSLAPLNIALLQRSEVRIPSYPTYANPGHHVPAIQNTTEPNNQNVQDPTGSCPMNIEEMNEIRIHKDGESVERRLVAIKV